MSLSGAHKAAFRREAAQKKRVFSIRDQDGFPAPEETDGTRAVPFWSKSSRAHKVVGQVAAYNDFDVVEIGMDDWLDHWLPGLEQNGYLVGVNWAGARATGYDVAPTLVAGWFTERS
jgi:hypothetical protein